MASKNCALTPENLAIIGLLDEFYDLYCDVYSIYQEQQRAFRQENGNARPLWGKHWDDLCNKAVRNLFEPFLQSHISVFSNDVIQGHANTYALQSFSFIKAVSKNAMIQIDGPSSPDLISFSEFLYEFQLVACNLHFRWKNNCDPSLTLGKAWQEVNDRINNLTCQYEQERILHEDETEETTGYILYIYDNLHNTKCHRRCHTVVPAKFVANFATNSRRIILPVHYCEKCKKYMIGKKTLALFESRYGKLLVNKHNINNESTDFDLLRIESKLHQLGYNVIRDGMSHEERKTLLINLLEQNLISYFEVCATLEHNIRFFKASDRHQLAVQKWKMDLKAVGEYIISKKRLMD